MGLSTVILLALGLSMDAFAVSVGKGLSMKRVTLKNAAICGVWFGAFQALMPLIGFILGSRFEKYIVPVAPWVAFLLLAIIGGNMISEAFEKEEKPEDAALDIKTMFLMAVATSIDALAVGITFSCEPVTIIPALRLESTLIAIAIIGVITFALSCLGVKIGNVFGTKYKSKAEFFGGLILIAIGIKILLENLLK